MGIRGIVGATCLLLVSVWASCSVETYETVVGGYPAVSQGLTMVFDLSPNNDLIVGGLMSENTVDLGYLYYISEETCQIGPVLHISQFDEGVTVVKFETGSNPQKVFGIAQGSTNYIFSLDLTSVTFRTEEVPSSTLGFDTIGGFFMLETQSNGIILSTDAGVATHDFGNFEPRVYATTSGSFAHFQSSYSQSRGLFAPIYYHDYQVAALARYTIAETRYPTMEAVYQMTLNATPKSVSSATVAHLTDADTAKDILSAAFCYNFDSGEEMAGYQVEFVSITTDSDSVLESQNRLLLQAQKLDVLAANSLTTTTSVFLFNEVSSEESRWSAKRTLVLIDFAANTFSFKEAITPSYITTSSVYAQFLPGNTQDFYLSYSGRIVTTSAEEMVGYYADAKYHPQALLETSLDSRRPTSIFSTSTWKSTLPVPSDKTVVTQQSVEAVLLAFKSEQRIIKRAVTNDLVVSQSYVNEAFPGLDSDPQRTLRINLGPWYEFGALDNVDTTFGERVEVALSVYKDLEGDPLMISVNNNRFDFRKIEMMVYEGYPVYKFVSDELVEGVNAELGPTTVTVIWTDLATGQFVEESFTITVLSNREYQVKELTGQVQDSETLELYDLMYEKRGELSDEEFQELVKTTQDEMGYTQKIGASQSTTETTSKTCTMQIQSTTSDDAKTDDSSQAEVSSQPEKSYEDLYNDFMKSYGTSDNYLRVYGGPVSAPEPSLSDEGLLEIEFSRTVHFPTFFLIGFDDSYSEDLPNLEPTVLEKAAIQANYDDLVEAAVTAAEAAQLASERAAKTAAEYVPVCVYDDDEDDDQKDKDDSDKKDKDDNEKGTDGKEEPGGSTNGKGEGGLRRLQSLDSLWTRNPDLSKSLSDRLTVSIYDNSTTLEDEALAQLQEYTWSIKSVSSTSLAISINFKHPQVYGSKHSEQRVRVQAAFSDFEPGWDDEAFLVDRVIPKQHYEPPQTAATAAAAAAGASTQAATAATLGANIMMSGAMSQVWGMINGLQILINLPLFNVNFPSMSQGMIDNLINIATFDVLPTDDVFDATIEPPESLDVDEKFSSVGYESDYITVNLGTLYLTLVLTIILVPAWLCLTRPCTGCSTWVSKKHSSLLNMLRGNFFIRFLMEGCLDIAICSALNTIQLFQAGELPFETTFDIVNNVSLIVLTLALAVFPVWVLIFYCKNFVLWEEEHFENKYGAVFEGLKKNQRSSLAYPMIFIYRRFALVMIAILTKEIIFVQIVVMLVFSIAQVLYLVTYEPFENPLLQKLDIFNEVTTVLLVDLLTAFTDANPIVSDIQLDCMFLACLFGNIAVHLFFLIKDTVVSTKAKCKRKDCCMCCRKKKPQKTARRNIYADLVPPGSQAIQLKVRRPQAKTPLDAIQELGQQEEDEKVVQVNDQDASIEILAGNIDLVKHHSRTHVDQPRRREKSQTERKLVGVDLDSLKDLESDQEVDDKEQDDISQLQMSHDLDIDLKRDVPIRSLSEAMEELERKRQIIAQRLQQKQRLAVDRDHMIQRKALPSYYAIVRPPIGVNTNMPVAYPLRLGQAQNYGAGAGQFENPGINHDQTRHLWPRNQEQNRIDWDELNE